MSRLFQFKIGRLGQFFAIIYSFSRIIEAVRLPTLQGWLLTIALLLLYGAIALPLGFWRGFLRLNLTLPDMSRWQLVRFILHLLIAPALVEELVFRVLLIPHPTEGADALTIGFWGMASLLLFILYHPLNALLLYRTGFPTFLSPIFLTLAGLLGVVCTIAYLQIGSLWAIVLIHWVVVTVWLLVLNGYQTLNQNERRSLERS